MDVIEIQIYGLILLTIKLAEVVNLRQFFMTGYLPKIEFSAAVNTTSAVDNKLAAFTGTLIVG